jgi:hypothetical protein
MAKYIKSTSLQTAPNTEDVIIGGELITKKSPWVDIRAYSGALNVAIPNAVLTIFRRLDVICT